MEEIVEDEIQIEMLDTTEAYLQHVVDIALQNFGALERVRGNLLFHVVDVATINIVTSGPLKGVHEDPTDEPADFCFFVHQWALVHVLEPDMEGALSIPELIEMEGLEIAGDVEVYKRFMALGQSRRNSLSIRCQ